MQRMLSLGQRKQILDLLCNGTYKDPEGKYQKVAGDMTKVWRCQGLTTAAKKLLAAVVHTSQRVDGDSGNSQAHAMDVVVV